ncbi:tyrosine aminotransferase [Anthonomus grandis grandis]|uniref:tyrosine aminotransferase n=1 Tax=Anthonomus grandis grandis TaxID=2921223 RepID=UPI00216612D5|nr:tyrosine aminotransferase [Anthonomus grandis grandis]
MLEKLIKTGEISIFDSARSCEFGKRELWKVDVSTSAKNCRNFIREIVDTLDLQPNPTKPVIALSLGDPTVYGNLKPAPEVTRAVVEVVEEGLCNGYAPSTGYESARAAVAEYLNYDGVSYNSRDIILCSGCSSSLELCITALCDGSRGQNILIPRPGFAIYRTLAESIGVEVKYYNLIPERNWEVDLQHLEEQINEHTAAIVLNNPSNPCGSNYSEEHLRSFLEIAYRRRVPVIADEIYERLVFPGKKFVSTASLFSEVPILVCGGTAKRFLVPGWRMGWIAVHDETGAFEHVRKALVSLSQRTIGSNTLIQGALPAILQYTPDSFHDDLAKTLALHAQIAFERFSFIRGLAPYMPEGAMYMIVEINLRCFPEFVNGLEFCKQMMREESVFCLPGECFQIPGFMRIVLTVPQEILEEACERIAEFCNRHYVE